MHFKSTISELSVKCYLCLFKLVYFSIFSIVLLYFIIIKLIINFKKLLGVCITHTSALVAPAYFERRMWRLLMVKNIHPSFSYMYRHILFHPVWSVSSTVRWFVIGRPFFFSFFFSLSFDKKWRLVFFIFGVCALVFFFWFLFFFCLTLY
jgi:hypothetical protein